MTNDAMERAALATLHAAADPDQRDRLGLAWEETGAGALSIAAALPASAIVVNRALGIGDGAATRQAVARFRAAGVARYFLNGPDGETAAAEGLSPVRGWQKFSRGRGEPVPDLPAAHAIREIGPAEGAAFAAIVCAAFDLGAAAEPWLARLPGQPGWRVFAAFDGATMTGCGAVLVIGDAAWTDWGATRPAFRGRGVQGALLAHRVRTALAMGVRQLHTCTGAAVPGDPQHSYRNILRCGFRETVLRPNWTSLKTYGVERLGVIPSLCGGLGDGDGGSARFLRHG